MRELVAVTVAIVVTATSATVAQSNILHDGLSRSTSIALEVAAGFNTIVATWHTDAVHSAKESLASRQDISIAYAGVAHPDLQIAATHAAGTFKAPEIPAFKPYFPALSHARYGSLDTTWHGIGEFGLALGTRIRDAMYGSPQVISKANTAFAESMLAITDGIFEAHNRFIFALATTPKPLMQHTVATVYRLGADTRKIAAATPTLAVRGYHHGIAQLAEIGPRVAESVVAAQIAFGDVLKKTSNETARSALIPVETAAYVATEIPDEIAYAISSPRVTKVASAVSSLSEDASQRLGSILPKKLPSELMYAATKQIPQISGITVSLDRLLNWLKGQSAPQEELCVGDQCLTSEQLKKLLELASES